MTGYRGRMSAACLTWVCLNLMGCATLQFPWEKSVPYASARNPVVQIICLWEPADGKDPEGKPCRGFAGQIIFSGNKGGTAVAVDGKVRVKQFDQFTGPADESDPYHQFDFDSQAWELHLVNGSLGPTYNVFIPYMRKGNHDAHCELVVEYTPNKGGAMVTSNVTSLLLKGKQSAKEVAAAKAAESLVPHTPVASNGRGVRTTTIPLDGRSSTTTPSSNEDLMAARLERMERIMQDFAAQQAVRPVSRPVEAAPVQETVAAGKRFSLNGSSTHTNEIVPTSATVAVEETQSARIPARGRAANLLSAHPLAMEDQPEASRAAATNVAQQPARRHPLADEPAFAGNALPKHRETPPATLVVPEELSDAPLWTREENTAGHATLTDELDGQTTQIR